MVCNKWDKRFLEMAKFVAQWSKDPSTQTGAVIVNPHRRVVSVGYNGFAAGVDDWNKRYENRELKYKLVVHCERNAIIFAEKSLHGCTLYTWPFMSCSPCAAMVIQAGIKRCVAPPVPDHLRSRWGDELELSQMQFNEAGVKLDFIEPGDGSRVVVCSGYFNPLHRGHLAYLKAAKKLGDTLVVIVNNDKQVALKGSTPFMDENERLEIVQAIQGVDLAVLAIDEDLSVSRTLEMVKPHVFANGGDVGQDQIREKTSCEKWGIEMAVGIGGIEKIQSSSRLLASV